jgi:hypothetical protein
MGLVIGLMALLISELRLTNHFHLWETESELARVQIGIGSVRLSSRQRSTKKKERVADRVSPE